MALRILIPVLLFVFSSCSHPLEIEGEGDIVSASGERNCSLEDQPCGNVVGGAYQETFTAAPRSGYEFAGWRGCGSETPECSFDVPAATVRDFWGKTMPPLVARFAPIKTAQSENFLKIVGRSQGDRAGWSVASAPDFDRDGIDDLLIGLFKTVDGEPLNDDIGYLAFSGGFSPNGPLTVNLGQTSFAQALGLFVSTHFDGLTEYPIDRGASLIGDYVMVDHRLNAGAQVQTALFLTDGIDATALGGVDIGVSPPTAGFRSTSLNDVLSLSVEGPVGDLNGDGVTDVAATSANSSLHRDWTFISGALIDNTVGLFEVSRLDDGISSGNVVRFSLAADLNPVTELMAAGDVDGDDADDFVFVTAPASGGALSIFVVSGAALFDDADGRVAQENLSPSELFEIQLTTDDSGFVSRTFGDIDGDGLNDIVFSSTGPPTQGRAVVYIIFGSALAADADGVLAIESLSPGQGAVIQQNGAEPSDRFAPLAVGVIGDITQDGKDEIAITVETDLVSSPFVARTYILRGDFIERLSTVSWDLTRFKSFSGTFIESESQSDGSAARIQGFGSSVARAFDLDRDGVSDLAVSAPLYSSPPVSSASEASGAIYVIPSSNLLNAVLKGETISLNDRF